MDRQKERESMKWLSENKTGLAIIGLELLILAALVAFDKRVFGW